VTEGSGGEACQGVACLPVQRQALFQQRPCLRLVPAGDECEAGCAERQGTLIGRQASAAVQEPFLVGDQPLGVAAQPPEPPGCS